MPRGLELRSHAEKKRRVLRWDLNSSVVEADPGLRVGVFSGLGAEDLQGFNGERGTGRGDLSAEGMEEACLKYKD